MSDPGGGPDQISGSDLPPETAESETFDLAADAKDTCEENKNQLETLKELMLRNKQSLKKKEEEVQEYAKKLSKIKSRAKLSRRSRDAATSVENTPEADVKSRISNLSVENIDDSVDDVSEAKTPKAKSSLLQKKLAENRKIFEQRSRVMTENKRAVEEKVEAIRQQLDESDTTILELQKELSAVSPVQPVVITTQVTASPGFQYFNVQDKDNRIAELSNKVLQLEATVLDLQENLKEKDSVIDSKTKAITLMSADLSKKSKSTLDTLEDTKDEMRTMQSNFVLIETSLKQKIDSLLQQLQGRDGQIAEYEDTIGGLKEDLEKRKITDSATADFSRSTLDTLAETKDAMKSMQENFVLIESSLKSKNNNLLEQLEEREMKLAEAGEKIFRLESGVGIVAAPPDVRELQSKLEILEHRNRQLQDEKYELQKSLAELQDKVISNEPVVSNGLIAEKDNRIAELENLIEELRKSNQLLLEESKTELQSQIVELTSRNEEYSNKVNELEKLLHNLETEKNELVKKIPEGIDESKEDARVTKLSKELDELNKSMIKLKTQHKSKVKSLQKQLESFKKVSDANAELVKLGNQVTLLEEEKGNLQLSLVDFDELKASAGDWQERIGDLETKISVQNNEIDSQVQAIATLENQKLDLMQELHAVKQEVSALEAENAESENLRVTAEMKIVELEEQLEALNKSVAERKPSDSTNESAELKEYLNKIEALSQENNNLIVKLAKFEDKGTSDAGSTESFETLHETDRNELLKKIVLLTQENSDLIIKLTKLEERTGSMESFENFNDSNKNDLLKKIDELAQENNNLIVKLAKFEEKSSSDSGSTESFDRIPEHVEHLSRLDLLTQENNELVIKLIKLEEKLAQIEDNPDHGSKSEASRIGEEFDFENRIYVLTKENNELVIQLTKLQEKMEVQFSNIPEVGEVRERAKFLAEENNELLMKVDKIGEENESLKLNLDIVTKERDGLKDRAEQMPADGFAAGLIEKLNYLNRRNENSARVVCEELSKLLLKLTEETTEVENSSVHEESNSITSLEKEIESCKKLINEQTELIDDMKTKLSVKEEELELRAKKINEYQRTGEDFDKLRIEFKDSLGVIEEWKLKCKEMEEKMKILESEKASIEEGLRTLEAENAGLVEKSDAEELERVKLKKELDDTISLFESRLKEEIKLASEREAEISALKEIIQSKDADLHDKYEKLQNEMITIDSLQDDMNNYKTLIEEQKTTIDSLRKDVESLNEEIGNAKAEIRKLNLELENSKSSNEFDELVKILNDNQETVKKMESKIREQNDENFNALNQIENLNSNIRNLEERLIEKQGENVQLMEKNKYLEEELNRAKTVELGAKNQVANLQNMLDENNIYLEDLRKELGIAYKKLEQVKSQHVEDSSMQNRRLEDLIDELNNKVKENETLKVELESRNKLLNENFTEEAKLALESRVTDLETKLIDSETKGTAQLDKMKKIAANLKKKAARCKELETELSEISEKWVIEKSEKEMINKNLQENEFALREKDDRILELEKRVLESQNQASMALENVEGLVREIDASKEKVNSLLEQVTEMGEEIVKLRSEINAKDSELENERASKLNVSSEYQTYKLEMEAKYDKQETDLEEATERARELRVRMEVMESEYVEQLSLIQKLKAENGMLSSKETQINEKLENVEKESEERKRLLEKFEKEKLEVIEKVEEHRAQTLDFELGETVPKASQEQSHTSLQALQAKLQERDAVVESLETELGKANERVNKLEEALVAVEERRYSLEKRTELLGAELEQSFRITEEASFSEDMLEQRLATLMAKDKAISEKLNETIDENNDLTEKIKGVENLNVALKEQINVIEEELKYARETNEKLQNFDVLYSELVQKYNQQEIDLKKTQQELNSAKQHIESSEQEVTSQINKLDGERKQLLETREKLEDEKTNLLQEIDSLKDGVSLCQQRISELETEVETLKEINENLTSQVNSRQTTTTDHVEDFEKLKSLLAEKDIEIENYQRRNMQLQMAAFDAPKSFDVSNVFDTSAASNEPQSTNEIDRLNNILSEKERQYADVCSELDNIKQRLAEIQSEYENTVIEKDQYRNELISLNDVISERNHEINSLNVQLNDVRTQLEEYNTRQRNYEEEFSKLSEIVGSKDDEIQAIRAELNLVNETMTKVKSSSKENDNLIDDKNTLIGQLENVKSIYESQLDDFKLQQQEAASIVDQIISVAEQKVNKIHEIQKEGNAATRLHKVASTFNELLAEFDSLKQENEELLRTQESQRTEVAELRKQLADYTGNNGNNEQVLELENQVIEITQKKNALEKLFEEQEFGINELKKQFDEVLTQKQSLENQLYALKTNADRSMTENIDSAISNDPGNTTLASIPVEDTIKKSEKLDLGSEWETGSTEKLDTEDEGWGWGAEEAQLEEEHNLQSASLLTPSVEIQLQTRVAELEDQLKDLELKREILDEESKATQLKNVKLVKKLKEFKLKNEMLQQKINEKQQSTSCFSDLDSAIEEELKSQIEKLEKNLKDSIQEQKKTLVEKEQLQKRLEVLTSANERFVEMKERQDMDIEVLQIRNKELNNKIQSLEWQLQEHSSSKISEEAYSSSPLPKPDTQSNIDHSSSQSFESREQDEQLCKRYKEEIDDLKEEMEALAAENEQLQNLLEEQKIRKVFTETNKSTDKLDGMKDIDNLKEENVNLQTSMKKLQEEYGMLRKQYEQSLMDANDQVTAMRQNNDLLRAELDAKSNEFDGEKQLLLKEGQEWNLRVDELKKKLEQAEQENSELLKKLEILESTEEKLSSVSNSLAEVTELLNSRVQEVSDLKQSYQQQYIERTEAENDLRSNIGNLNKELSKKEEEIVNLRQSLIDKENSIAQQQTAEIHSLKIELVTKEEELEKLRDVLANKESGMQKFNLVLEEEEKEVSRIDALKREIEELKIMLFEKESSLEKATSELAIRYRELAEKDSYIEWYKTEFSKYTSEIEKRQGEINELKNLSATQDSAETDSAGVRFIRSIEISEKEKEIEELKLALHEKNSVTEWYNQEAQKWSDELNRVNIVVSRLRDEVENKNMELARLNNVIIEKEKTIENLRQHLDGKEKEIHNYSQSISDPQKEESVTLADSFPRFKMASDDEFQLQTNVDDLKFELRQKQEQIEHFEYMLSKNTYPELLQNLQDNVDQLHTEKYEVEQSFKSQIQSLNEELVSKQTEIEKLERQVEVASKENNEASLVERTLPSDQEAIARLQNELHTKEQEMNELRYVIAEKDSQISMQASSSPQFDEFEIQESLQRLNGDLYAKQQEVEYLKRTLLEKEKDIEDLNALKIASVEHENLISKLSSEKESIREEAETLLQSRLADKEAEINIFKQRLAEENKELLESLKLKDTDITNLRIQMEQLNAEHIQSMYLKDEEILLVKSDLAEKERRLAEVSITKDAEIHNLRVQIHDKEIRIEELTALSEEEEKQLNELRKIVESKEGEINNLKALLNETVQEYENIEKLLKRGSSHRSADSASAESGGDQTSANDSPSKEGEKLIPDAGVVSVEGELDLALYMLHQRDVRCEELTLELMQLLEERDTLQLRLSNAIRVNEDLRRNKSTAPSPKKEPLPSTSSDEPLVEHPSPTKTDGPVEIAKEALAVESGPIDEDKDALAKKLSELHTVHQRRDVTLCDERESRHTQQMSFVARRDMLNSLPPEAAARLVNANYTLSRDVQSQSSVLLNWLWGKSTPKVMHM